MSYCGKETKDISETASCDNVRIWKKAFITVVSQQEIIRLIKNFNEKYNSKKMPKFLKGAGKLRRFFDPHFSCSARNQQRRPQY